MQKGAGNLQFEFANEADKLVSSLEFMLGHISSSMPAGADADAIMFKCKVIITELLTNAIKHAGNGKTMFNIDNDGTRLVISKTDYGMPLYLVNGHSESQADTADSNKKLISADPLTSLYANFESESHIRFSSEEGSLDDFLSVEQVMEHFGILIITNSSDEFTYTYHKDIHSNVFRVLVNF